MSGKTIYRITLDIAVPDPAEDEVYGEPKDWYWPALVNADGSVLDVEVIDQRVVGRTDDGEPF